MGGGGGGENISPAEFFRLYIRLYVNQTILGEERKKRSLKEYRNHRWLTLLSRRTYGGILYEEHSWKSLGKLDPEGVK